MSTFETPSKYRFNERPFVGDWQTIGRERSHFVAVPTIVNGFGQVVEATLVQIHVLVEARRVGTVWEDYWGRAHAATEWEFRQFEC